MFTHPSLAAVGVMWGCAVAPLPFWVPQASVFANPCQWAYGLPPEQLWPLGAPGHELSQAAVSITSRVALALRVCHRPQE